MVIDGGNAAMKDQDSAGTSAAKAAFFQKWRPLMHDLSIGSCCIMCGCWQPERGRPVRCGHQQWRRCDGGLCGKFSTKVGRSSGPGCILFRLAAVALCAGTGSNDGPSDMVIDDSNAAMEDQDSAASSAAKPAEVAAPVAAARTGAQNRILTKLLDELIFHARAEVAISH